MSKQRQDRPPSPLVRINPLEDITAYQEIELVMQNGTILDIGYHYDFASPIPWPAGNVISYPGQEIGFFDQVGQCPTTKTG